MDLSTRCLEAFEGEYIVHVGELVTTGTLSGGDQAPFGRSTGAEFSVALASTFHCLLCAFLPRMPYSNDCITVWKRTDFVPGRSVLLGEEEEGEEGGEGEGGEDDMWACIPTHERLPQDIAAPCMEHLLDL
ncbi:hypothetical protein B484DRAFT_160361 [Ochromonadaceae sp. CCMP2298]|nr:hypothetical protein B484DRAFT_160361 [Ochromonadaceae sp. CCMP2298]